MPWKDVNAMSQRLEFVLLASQADATVRDRSPLWHQIE